MKIKSGATGEMVEARVGMVVCFHPSEVFTISDVGRDIYFKGAEFGSESPMKTSLPELLTLLHCPFQVGDEVEVCDMGAMETYWDKKVFDFMDEKIINQDGEYKGVKYKKLFRHVNPNLRDCDYVSYIDYVKIAAELARYKESWKDAEPPEGFPLLSVRKLLDDGAQQKQHQQQKIDALRGALNSIALDMRRV